MVRLVIDGDAFRRSATGGVPRVFREILPRICDLDPTLQVDMLVERGGGSLPTHARIHPQRVLSMHRLLHPSRLWAPILEESRAFATALTVRSDTQSIWHSSYYTVPMRWRGPVVVTVHDLIYERFPELFPRRGDDRFRARMRRCVLSADAIICVSATTRTDVEAMYGVPRERTVVIPLAASDAFVAARTQDAHKAFPEPFILYVGARQRHKNFAALIEAYARWPMRTEVLLVVAGHGWSSDEQVLLARREIADRVRLAESPSDRTLAHLYREASALVFPSLFEGFGIPLLEAMSCGCPIVASSIPTTHEVAGPVPFYFEPGSDDALAAALDQAMAEGRTSARALAGIERARGFSWDVTAARTLEVYRSLLT